MVCRRKSKTTGFLNCVQQRQGTVFPLSDYRPETLNIQFEIKSNGAFILPTYILGAKLLKESAFGTNFWVSSHHF